MNILNITQYTAERAKMAFEKLLNKTQISTTELILKFGGYYDVSNVDINIAQVGDVVFKKGEKLPEEYAFYDYVVKETGGGAMGRGLNYIEGLFDVTVNYSRAILNTNRELYHDVVECTTDCGKKILVGREHYSSTAYIVATNDDIAELVPQHKAGEKKSFRGAGAENTQFL